MIFCCLYPINSEDLLSKITFCKKAYYENYINAIVPGDDYKDFLCRKYNITDIAASQLSEQ